MQLSIKLTTSHQKNTALDFLQLVTEQEKLLKITILPTRNTEWLTGEESWTKWSSVSVYILTVPRKVSESSLCSDVFLWHCSQLKQYILLVTFPAITFTANSNFENGSILAGTKWSLLNGSFSLAKLTFYIKFLHSWNWKGNHLRFSISAGKCSLED